MNFPKRKSSLRPEKEQKSKEILANVCVAVTIPIVVFLVGLYIKKIDAFGSSRERKQYKYAQLAEDFDIWNKYVNDDDPDNEKNMTRSEHAGYSTEEKLQILTNRFGKEK